MFTQRDLFYRQVVHETSSTVAAMNKVVDAKGVEPLTFRVRTGSSEPIELRIQKKVAENTGFEPVAESSSAEL